jgi:hypothetical protein
VLFWPSVGVGGVCLGNEIYSNHPDNVYLYRPSPLLHCELCTFIPSVGGSLLEGRPLPAPSAGYLGASRLPILSRTWPWVTIGVSCFELSAHSIQDVALLLLAFGPPQGTCRGGKCCDLLYIHTQGINAEYASYVRNKVRQVPYTVVSSYGKTEKEKERE